MEDERPTDTIEGPIVVRATAAASTGRRGGAAAVRVEAQVIPRWAAGAGGSGDHLRLAPRDLDDVVSGDGGGPAAAASAIGADQEAALRNAWRAAAIAGGRTARRREST